MTTVITLPRHLDLDSALSLGGWLSALQQEDDFVFDFQGVTGVIEPFGMLIASGEMRRLKARFPAATFVCRNYKHLSYPAHMGFFRSFGLDTGNAPGQAPGSASYVPITLIRCEHLRASAADEGVHVGDAVEAESKRLAGVLCGDEESPLFQTLSYSVRELMRNIVEHSEAPDIELCAQFWPKKSKVEVAILDRGVGIRQTLARNPHIDASDDQKALNYALMPAVSGKAFKGSKRRERGPWGNSGFGLYMTNRICRNGGSFFIASGGSGLLNNRTNGKKYFKTSYEGTAVRMVIKTEQLPELRSALERYRIEGYEIQRKYAEIVDIDPSSASLMLSEDFDLGVVDRIWSTLTIRTKGA